MRLSTFIKFLTVAVIFMAFEGLECMAYDFPNRYKGNVYYFNITSPTTCEITFKDVMEEDGQTVYNTTYALENNSLVLPKQAKYMRHTYEVVGIGDHAFENTDVKSVGLQLSGLSYIGDEAFKNCTNLRHFLCQSGTEMGESVCENCTSLHQISIFVYPEQSCRIPSRTFHGCNSIESVHIMCNRPENIIVEPDAFDVADGKIDCTLYIEYDGYNDDMLEQYQALEPWCFFTNFEYSYPMPTDPDGVEEITVTTRNNAVVYNLYGQKVGTEKDLPSLPRGIYIVNGKKVVR